jgi:16S rRNA (adenine1518-N6/adenine1519-N6)-dimethyltransferase
MPQARRPKLGQHFLRDTHYRQRIAEALAILPDDLVIEIGPGRGAMTELLAERAGHVVAIEIDAGLAQNLAARLAGNSRIEILQADILNSDLAALCRRHRAEKCFAFGNLPYYITSPIIRHLFGFAGSLRAMTLLVQREVAERLAAQPGSRAYGYLSVLTRLHSHPRIVLRVPPGAFSPPPKVHSALVDFQIIPPLPERRKAGEGSTVPPASIGTAPSAQPLLCAEEEAQFLDFVKRCFAQKRKNLVNNLAGICSRERIEHVLAVLALPANIRGEQLTVEQFASLFWSLR